MKTTRKTVYLGLDVHARHCVLGSMDTRGKFLGEERFATSETQLIRHVVNINARQKLLSMEEGPMAQWIGQVLTPYVKEILICDPQENLLISRNARKCDELDTLGLCRLHRLGELKRVYHPQDDRRAVFKAAVQHYLAMVKNGVALKQQIKAKYRGWGVFQVDGQRLYTEACREEYLGQIKALPVRHQLRRLYGLMDAATFATKSAFEEMQALGRDYPEIAEFEKVPGVGPVTAHVFDAYIQTPERFATKQQLWRYSCLGVTDRSSDGKPLGYCRLDRRGCSELKAISYRAFLGAIRLPNEINDFYHRSLENSHVSTHARLSTQRKLLAVLWAMWKRKEPYRKEAFSDHQ
jgi:transposase